MRVRCAVGAAAVLALAGCANSGTPATPPATTTAQVAVGTCGGLTAEQVGTALVASSVSVSTRDALSCRFQSAADGASAVFAWYRGVPMQTRRGLGDAVDRTTDGHAGFTARRSADRCEAAIETGGGDFVDWLVDYGRGPAPADPCVAADLLADLTVRNRG